MSYVLTRARWTDYKIEMRTNVPVFKVKEATVRRRYSDFKVRLVNIRAWHEGYPKVREDFTITEKAPTRAFSWLKAPTSAFTFKTLLRHYAKRALTPRSLNVKLGPRRKGHKGRALVGAFSVIVQLHRLIDLRH